MCDFYDFCFVLFRKRTASMIHMYCDISHLLRPIVFACVFVCVWVFVSVLFLFPSSVNVSSLAYKFCANVCIAWDLPHHSSATHYTNEFAAVCVYVYVCLCDWLPEHLSPWWYKPYKSEPQWSQNVGLEYEYSLNSCLVRVSWW